MTTPTPTAPLTARERAKQAYRNWGRRPILAVIERAIIEAEAAAEQRGAQAELDRLARIGGDQEALGVELLQAFDGLIFEPGYSEDKKRQLFREDDDMVRLTKTVAALIGAERERVRELIAKEVDKRTRYFDRKGDGMSASVTSSLAMVIRALPLPAPLASADTGREG